jgi:hypothetical protein
VPTGNIVIQLADRVVAMRAERGRLEASRPVHLAIVNSGKVNLQWFNTYSQLVEQVIRAKMQEIKAVGEFSRALSRTSNQISEQRMRQWQETQHRQDRLNREWNKHAWVSRGGEYILTDNPNFNPNVERRGDWVEMQPTP